MEIKHYQIISKDLSNFFFYSEILKESLDDQAYIIFYICDITERLLYESINIDNGISMLKSFCRANSIRNYEIIIQSNEPIFGSSAIIFGQEISNNLVPDLINNNKSGSQKTTDLVLLGIVSYDIIMIKNSEGKFFRRFDYPLNEYTDITNNLCKYIFTDMKYLDIRFSEDIAIKKIKKIKIDKLTTDLFVNLIFSEFSYIYNLNENENFKKYILEIFKKIQSDTSVYTNEINTPSTSKKFNTEKIEKILKLKYNF